MGGYLLGEGLQEAARPFMVMNTVHSRLSISSPTALVVRPATAA